MAVALFLAVMLNQKMRGERIFRMAFYLPVILGFNTAVLLCWRLMLNTGTGIINQLIRSVSLAFPPFGYLSRGVIFIQELTSAFFLGINSGKFNLMNKVLEAGFPAANRVPLWVQSPLVDEDVSHTADGLGLRRDDADLPRGLEQHPQGTARSRRSGRRNRLAAVLENFLPAAYPLYFLQPDRWA